MWFRIHLNSAFLDSERIHFLIFFFLNMMFNFQWPGPQNYYVTKPRQFIIWPAIVSKLSTVFLKCDLDKPILWQHWMKYLNLIKKLDEVHYTIAWCKSCCLWIQCFSFHFKMARLVISKHPNIPKQVSIPFPDGCRDFSEGKKLWEQKLEMLPP